ncbi:MAG TPA: hypothetical protein VFJ15_14420 [Oleiagrimonas sp.]|nr:hypothetical protein [Oleiagrimonas sp.]
MYRLCASLVVLLSLLATGSAVAASGQNPLAQAGAHPMAAETGGSSRSALLPLWQARNGQSWALLTRGPTSASAPASTLALHGPGFTSRSSSGLEYVLNPQWAAHASVRQQSWLGSAPSVGSCLFADASLRHDHCTDGSVTPRLLGSEIGATFMGSGYSLGMDVTTVRPAASARLLPQVVPNAPLAATVDGVPFTALQGSTSLRARGRVALGEHSGIDMGASVGRIRLLPGNVLGVDTLRQKSLSLGVDSGSVSGRIIGRVVQPRSGMAVDALGTDERRWTSIDLGVTWHLPWQGSLSFGAQNLWSSGDAPEPKNGPKQGQSRIPYVQYHQDF